MDIRVKKFKIFLQKPLTNERKYGIICIVEQWIYKWSVYIKQIIGRKMT